MEKVSPSDQVLYFLSELYAILRSMPVVPVELTISGVVPFS